LFDNKKHKFIQFILHIHGILLNKLHFVKPCDDLWYQSDIVMTRCTVSPFSYNNPCHDTGRHLHLKFLETCFGCMQKGPPTIANKYSFEHLSKDYYYLQSRWRCNHGVILVTPPTTGVDLWSSNQFFSFEDVEQEMKLYKSNN
jgi:hypothetical protein